MPVLRRRDLAASVLIAVLLALYLPFLALGTFLGIGSSDDMACTVLILSGATVVLLADDDRYDAASWLTPILATAAVACAALSLISAAGILLPVAVATMLTLLCIQLAEHITFAPPSSRGPRPAQAPFQPR
ncbi:hypothetical protein E0H73_45175 [Kribbella pittospori]|uniref:Uncharacterized protein n=1 Tax=Kribbella pittospori TaxID=722689 RepID=A0A4R0JJA0_9ACTN|nr:hypothetical protein [Kribbella pittospori]TCC44876.1 hypothetical protein E0H73_45175 [Kribbella pittospori]